MLWLGAGSTSQLSLICKAKNSESINTNLCLQLAGQPGLSGGIFLVGAIRHREQAGSSLIPQWFGSLFYLHYRSACRPECSLDPQLGTARERCKRLAEPKDALDEFQSKEM